VEQAAAVGTTTWAIDAGHTTVGFSGKHMMFTTVRGRFRDVQGTIVYDEANPANSRVEATIDAGSLDSGVEQRDGHLKGADFFQVEEHPTITFRSTSVEPRGGDRAKVTGDLTIRGVTRPIVLDVELGGRGKNPWGKDVIGFEGRTTINRKDWGLTWNVGLETGGFLVSEDINLELDVQAVKAE
jgi:polyisoprenoid-binding protein YceI